MIQRTDILYTKPKNITLIFTVNEKNSRYEVLIQSNRDDRVEALREISDSYLMKDDWELFDLEQDPNELQSVYGDPAYQEIQSEMLAELERLREEYQVPEDRRN